MPTRLTLVIDGVNKDGGFPTRLRFTLEKKEIGEAVWASRSNNQRRLPLTPFITWTVYVLGQYSISAMS